jgi:hypothetical protein
MGGIGKTLIVLGLVLVAVGVVVSLAPKLPWLGQFPGDILIKGKRFTFYFPLMTSILISVIVSLVLYLFRR